VTGTAGFIGSFLARKLRESGCEVIGIDTITDYYDVDLKKDRLAKIASGEGFQNLELDISDRAAMEKLFTDHSFDAVVNLAAQPGVRYSLINPASYIDTNLGGYLPHKQNWMMHRQNASLPNACIPQEGWQNPQD